MTIFVNCGLMREILSLPLPIKSLLVEISVKDQVSSDKNGKYFKWRLKGSDQSRPEGDQ